MDLVPISAIIPTRHRVEAFRRTVASLSLQSCQPAEILVVDASDNSATKALCQAGFSGLRSSLCWVRALSRGAASQRNEGVAYSSHSVIAFFDDDISFETDCVARLWEALNCDPLLGGVNATITNQGYTPPGSITRALFRFIHGWESSYAGRVIGPGVNLLPEDRPDLPEVVPVEWINTTCTLYRREALPDPPFPAHFTGYSMCEDLTLSLTVGRRWKLANARTARIFHDSQPGDHKQDPAKLAEMEIVNRHYVMTQVLGRRSLLDYLRLGLWEAYQVASAVPRGPRAVAAELAGKAKGMAMLIAQGVRHG